MLYGRMHVKADCQRNDAGDAAYNNNELRSDNQTRSARNKRAAASPCFGALLRILLGWLRDVYGGQLVP